MSLRIAVQMDPIERINIRGDSTFALRPEARPRGHSFAYSPPARLALEGGKASPFVQPLSVRDAEGAHSPPGPMQQIDLSTLDVVLLRQDPPFDLAYIT